MASWTVLCKGKEGDTQGKAFGVTLDTNSNTWTSGGPEVGMFLVTRSGTYKVAGVPENGTQLVKPGPTEVAFFRGLNGSSRPRDKGTGRASEKGVNFDWTLDSQ